MKKKNLRKMVMGAALLSVLFFATQGICAQETSIIRLLTDESDPESVEAYYTIIDQYQEQHPNVNVILELGTFRDLNTIIAHQMAVGNPTDIMMLDSTLVPTFANQDYLLPLNDLIEDVGEEDFKASSIFKIRGNYYSVPYAGEAHVLWIRKDLMKKYGVKKPETWDEWLEYSEKLTLDLDGDERIDIYGSLIPAALTGAADNVVREVNWAAGGQLFNRDLEVVYDSPESVQALEFLGKLAKYSPPGITNYSWWEQIESYITGRGAMTIYGGRVLTQVNQKAPDLLEKVDAVLLPKGPKFQSNLLVWATYAVSRITRHPKVTKDFLKFLITGDSAVVFCNTVPAHFIPALHSVEKDPRIWEPEIMQKYPDIAKLLFDQAYAHAGGLSCAGQIYQGKFTYGITNPYAGAVALDNTIAKVLQRHLVGGMSAEEAVKWGAKRLGEVKQEYEELFK